ncbi:MAG: hypothetical protein E7351_01730 [Clostridiales bacterium]|nr:hypothetical protein [Clostridiales bacterium]
MKKLNCIIDCDPGVDDTAAISLSLYDELMDIKLITTVSGNLDIDIVTRNVLHILEKFERTDIPVAKGASKPFGKSMPNAAFIHQKKGMGGYIPPDMVETRPIETEAVEAMYEIIKQNKNDISIVMLGPHTNVAKLIKKHPDVVSMINHIYCEGCAPYGLKGEGKWTNYISFNASFDAVAMKIVVESGIPVTIVPSRMGRELANFNEEEVFKIRDINDVGKFFFEMYNQYWEHNYDDRRIATNDTCACLALRFPKLFKTKKATVSVNIDDMYGRTDFTFTRKGNVNYVYKVNKKKMHEYFFGAIKKLDRFKFYK